MLGEGTSALAPEVKASLLLNVTLHAGRMTLVGNRNIQQGLALIERTMARGAIPIVTARLVAKPIWQGPELRHGATQEADIARRMADRTIATTHMAMLLVTGDARHGLRRRLRRGGLAEVRRDGVAGNATGLEPGFGAI